MAHHLGLRLLSSIDDFTDVDKSPLILSKFVMADLAFIKANFSLLKSGKYTIQHISYLHC